MELVVDSNRIIAALLKDSVSRKTLLSTKFSFSTVEFGIGEVKKYKGLIQRKASLTEKDFNRVMELVLPKISVYSEKEISKKAMETAIKAMSKIDSDDVPFLALAIQLGEIPIWTDDRHFKQQRLVKVFTTQQLVNSIID